MEELLQRYRCASAFEQYSIMRVMFFDGNTITAANLFYQLESHNRTEFISSMSPNDPAFTFFSTRNFTELVEYRG